MSSAWTSIRSKARLIPDQAPELRAKRVRQGLGERGEKDSSVWIGPSEVAARCRATMVLPVPAEPETRAGPLKSRSTHSRCSGWRKTVHFSHGKSGPAPTPRRSQ